MKEWITIFLAWWVVPITMIAFWLRYIPRHDWFGTGFHIKLIIISVAFAIIFHRLCALTLQGKEKTIFRYQNFWKDRRFYYGVGVFVVAVLFSFLSLGAIRGIEPQSKFFNENKKIKYYRIKEFVPKIFRTVGYDVFADFREKTVSEKPENYWLISENNQLKSVKGANLKGKNLTNADMIEAFLVKADFR